MISDLRKGVQTGLIFGAIVLFLTLIGFTVVGSGIIANLVSEPGFITYLVSLLIFLGVIGILGGVTAMGSEDKSRLRDIVRVTQCGLSAGAVAGLIIGSLIYLMGVQLAIGVDIRQYLVQMSPDAITYLTFGQQPLIAGLIYLCYFVVTNVAGAFLRWLYATATHAASESEAVAAMLQSAAFKYSVIGLLMVAAQLVLLKFDQTIWTYVLDVIAAFMILGLRRGRRHDSQKGLMSPVALITQGAIVGLIYGVIVAAVTMFAITFKIGPLLPHEDLVSTGILLAGIAVGVNVVAAVIWHILEFAGTNLTESFVSRYAIFGYLVLYLLTFPLRLDRSGLFTFGTVAIYVLLGLGLNIVVGLAGLLDLGYVVFFAIGAYTVGLLTAPEPHHLNWSFWLTIPFGIGIAAFIGVLLGVPVLRLRGDYLAIVTLGFGEIIRILSKSDLLSSFSRGPKGVPGIALPQIGGKPIDQLQFVYLILIAVMIVIFITTRLQHSRIGRAWIAMREDETVAQAMGINTLRYKLLAFGIGAALAGIGGLLAASRNQFTGPDEHTFLVSINVLAVVIVGGMGSIPGVILGAFVLKGVPEILRQLEDYRIITFGALLVVMMILRPEGLWPLARRRRELHEKEEEEELKSPGITAEGEALS
jgi:ABC-type branched-subunit amino acid transport system permease subunit